LLTALHKFQWPSFSVSSQSMLSATAVRNFHTICVPVWVSPSPVSSSQPISPGPHHLAGRLRNVVFNVTPWDLEVSVLRSEPATLPGRAAPQGGPYYSYSVVIRRLLALPCYFVSQSIVLDRHTLFVVVGTFIASTTPLGSQIGSVTPQADSTLNHPQAHTQR
jgi:hypothetical protein